MKKVFCIVISFIMLTTLVACGGGNQTQPQTQSQTAEPAEKGQTGNSSVKLPPAMTIVTSASTGTWLPVGTGVGEMLNKYTNTKVTPQTTTGSVENIRLLSQGDAELGIAIITDLTVDAKNGTGPFEGEKIDNVSVIAGAFPSAVQILVRADSGIKTVKDLAGKIVNTGPAGTYGSVILKWLFESYGMDSSAYKEINQGWTDSYEALGDGDIDCVFAVGAYPNSGMTSLATTTPINFIPLSDEDIAMLMTKDPTFYKTSLPAGTYPGQDEEVITIANPAGFIVQKDMDDDVVYTITKLLYEHISEFESYSPLIKFIKPETALSGVPLDSVHPGAMRYYEETNNPGLK
jgi:TRAP transporter TAXI family solute receptor